MQALPLNLRMLTVTDLVGAARIAIKVYQLGWGAENDASEHTPYRFYYEQTRVRL
jgi:hypothetical protein